MNTDESYRYFAKTIKDAVKRYNRGDVGSAIIYYRYSCVVNTYDNCDDITSTEIVLLVKPNRYDKTTDVEIKDKIISVEAELTRESLAYIRY